MTASCNATAPIDLPTTSPTNPIVIKFNCVYDSNLCSGAAVTVSSDLSHASINCNRSNSNAITFSGIIYIPNEIRIYSPSLHKYNGVTADAEMLIVHSPSSTSGFGSTSNQNPGLIVSIPIKFTSSSSSANSDLTAMFQAISGISASTIAVNASAPIHGNINVNSFIPAKPYYVYYGTLPYDSCGGNYYYAAFIDPIYASGPLGNLVASKIAVVPKSMKTNLQKSKTGPATGAGSGAADKYVLIELVGDDDSADTGANNSSKDNADKIKQQAMGMNVLWGIIVAILVMGIAWLFRKWVPASAGGVEASPAATVASASASSQ